jgi:hypothetical protein
MDDWLFITSPGMMLDYMTKQWREEQEGKPITLNSTLSAALNKCPVQWIDGICLCVGLDPKAQRKKKDRVKAVVSHLGDPDVLRAVVTSLSEQGQHALAFLLEKGGWVKIGSLTRKFGTMDDVGWFWDEKEPPTSPLGQLRVRGLLFVGKAGISGRNYTVAVVPRDLREPLRESL